MFELIIRLCIAGAVAYTSREFGTPPFEWAFPITTAYGLWATGCALISRRWEGLGSSLNCIADVAAIGIFVGASGSLNTFGFLALLPAVYAISRRRAHPIIASTAGLSMYLGFMMFAKGTPALDFHAKAIAMTLAACLAIPRRSSAGFLVDELGAASVEIEDLTQRRKGRKERKGTPQIEGFLPDASATGHEGMQGGTNHPLATGDDQELELLRAINERLAERHRRLEEEVRRETATRELISFRSDSIPALAAKVAEVTESEAVAIYIRSESADDLVVQGAFGQWPTILRDTAIPLIPGENADGMRWALESQVSGLLDDGHHSTALLEQDNRVIGLLIARHDQDHDARLKEIAESVTTIVIESAEKRRAASRLREAEILYSVASITQGATTPDSLAERIVRELSTLVQADGLAIYWTADHESKLGATSGVAFDIAPVLVLQPGPGIDGWLAAGAPEIAAFRTMADACCNPGAAMQSRIGSFIMIPLQSGHEPFGFLLAATHRSGGLDTSDLLSLRTLGIEISRTLARLNQPIVEEGLVTPTEFHELTRVGGAIVYIEPLHSNSDAIRQFAHIVRGKLPATGIACRRDQDDLLAFLSGYSHEQAVSWANEIQALASMISAGGKPLAVRTKVAYLPNRVISAA